MARILLVSDNDFLAKDLSNQLHLHAPDFEVFVEDSNQEAFDIVVIDDMPSKVHDYGKTPIVLLSSNNDVFDTSHIQVLAKPIKLSVFLDTINAFINIFANSADGIISFNQYELNSGSKEVKNLRNEVVTKITEREVAVLKYLYKHSGKTISKSELLSEVWGYSFDTTTHTIETHIYRLRQKIEMGNKDYQIIITQDNGYRLKL